MHCVVAQIKCVVFMHYDVAQIVLVLCIMAWHKLSCFICIMDIIKYKRMDIIKYKCMFVNTNVCLFSMYYGLTQISVGNTCILKRYKNLSVLHVL